MDLGKSLLELKDKLKDLENNYDDRYDQLKNREKCKTSLNEKLSQLAKIQKDNIVFNIGGKKIKTLKSLIENSLYDSILKDVIVSLQDNNKNIDQASKVFIDRNPDSFHYIIEVIRKANTAYIKAEFDKDNLEKQCIIVERNKEFIIDDINYYFKEDADKVLSDFEIVNKSEDINLGNDTNKPYNGILSFNVSSELPGDQLNPYRTSEMKDISKITSKKAAFVSYDSHITFELPESKEISCLELKPFTANLDYWVPCEGAGAFIFSSETGTGETDTWDFCNSISEDWGLDFENNKTYKIYFDKKKLKFLRILTGDYTFSVSYAKVS